MSFRSTILTGFGLLAAVSACASPAPEASYAQLGEPLTVAEATSISAILADPDAYVGEQLRVEGTVVGVCEHRGCWMAISGENDGEQLRVKVDDGVIVFPMTAMGLHARAEGVMEKLELTVDQLIAQAEQQAEEHGTEFDPATITEPRTIYQLRGLGAEIDDAD
jgi:hypothetical protein